MSGEVGILIAKVKDIQTLSPRDQHVLRFYVQGGNLTEVRYRDEPEVRVILKKLVIYSRSLEEWANAAIDLIQKERGK